MRFIHNRRRLIRTAVVFFLVSCAVFSELSIAKAQVQTPKLSKEMVLSSTTNAGVYRFKIGSFNATIVSDGILTVPPLPTYAPTADPAKVRSAMIEHFQSPNELSLYFDALYVNTGRNKVLIDTGAGTELGADLGRLADNLKAAGIQPQTIDTVILTHAHPDHIGGIVAPDSKLTFPNARYYISQPEWAFWTAQNINLDSLKIDDSFKQRFVAVARKHFGAIANRVTQFQPDREIVPGIKAIAAYGHTPGQSALLITSGDNQLVVAADVFFNEAFDLKHPDWQTGFDFDPAQAAESRRRLLNQIANNRMMVIAYHMPFPSLGHIRVRDESYEWEPVLWKFEP
jgi:glyoxylase-like metal-dependent hydrolase (beta-lactamase superfamily II)